MAKLTNIPPKEKQEKATPIHAFEGLQKLLRSMGYNVRTANGYKAMQTKDIGRDEIRNITIKDDGIYYKDDDGELRKIFMYKRKYHLEEYGKPRFHIRQCEVISDFMRRGSFNAEYRGANIETVKVIDTDNGNTETSVSELPLCKYCQGMAAAEFPRVITSKEFVEKLKEEGEAMEPQEDVEVDFRGYTKDWRQIQNAYLQKSNYTCGSCGIHIENAYDYRFLRVHHKNNKRADNRQTNLICLCPRCYNKTRKDAPSKAENDILKDFNDKYKDANG